MFPNYLNTSFCQAIKFLTQTSFDLKYFWSIVYPTMQQLVNYASKMEWIQAATVS